MVAAIHAAAAAAAPLERAVAVAAFEPSAAPPARAWARSPLLRGRRPSLAPPPNLRLAPPGRRSDGTPLEAEPRTLLSRASRPRGLYRWVPAQPRGHPCVHGAQSHCCGRGGGPRHATQPSRAAATGVVPKRGQRQSQRRPLNRPPRSRGRGLARPRGLALATAREARGAAARWRRQRRFRRPSSSEHRQIRASSPLALIQLRRRCIKGCSGCEVL